MRENLSNEFFPRVLNNLATYILEEENIRTQNMREYVSALSKTNWQFRTENVQNDTEDRVIIFSNQALANYNYERICFCFAVF